MILNNGRTEFWNTSDAGRSAAGTLPAATTKSGLITSVGTKVSGDGDTLFLSELKVGGWIYLNDELRRIASINSDDLLYVESAFSADTAVAEAIKYIEKKLYKEVSILNYGGANGVIGGSVGGNTAFPDGTTFTEFNEAGLEPIAFDATGTTFFIQILY